MTYETRIGIEIERIRRFIRVEVDYHVETVDGERLAVHDAIRVLCNQARMPGKWIYTVIGPRQLRELNGRLLEQWDSQKHGSARKKK